MQSLFMIAVESGDIEGVKKKLKGKEVPFHTVSKTALVLSHDGTTGDIKELAGIQEDGVAVGAIFGLSGAYAGYADTALWEWLKKYE